LHHGGEFGDGRIGGGGDHHFFPAPGDDGEVAARLGVADQAQVSFVVEDGRVDFNGLAVGDGDVSVGVGLGEAALQLNEFAEADGVDGRDADEAFDFAAQGRGILELCMAEDVAAIFGRPAGVTTRGRRVRSRRFT
jgi:hypothetical protein